MRFLGIDEAGRGPIVGPLIVAGLSINESQEKELIELGVKDSKLLTDKKRKSLYKILTKKFKFRVLIVSAFEVDEALGSSKSNLNWLEAEKYIELINDLDADRVFIDCPSTNVKAFKSYVVERLLNKKLDLVVEHKADMNYPVVSAASIIAKEEREMAIAEIKQRINFDFGSGYMADPKTQEFLEKYWDVYPELFRKSWEPYKKISLKRSQKNLGEY
ncbi:ribonuclease HII [Candidatus Woesearchaeota archaeon]|nr:MAG: ribonuclease HII [Candidatus Woesearchaeota archaeon]